MADRVFRDILNHQALQTRRHNPIYQGVLSELGEEKYVALIAAALDGMAPAERRRNALQVVANAAEWASQIIQADYGEDGTTALLDASCQQLRSLPLLLEKQSPGAPEQA